MRFGKVLCRYIVTTVFVVWVWQTMACSASVVQAKASMASGQVEHKDSAEKGIDSHPRASDESDPAKPKDRSESIRAVVSHLGLGEGSVVADIGAGNGKDTWVFAEIVGETGKVHPEEIAEDKVKSLKDSAEKKGLTQVTPVLGRSDDPCLPADSIDLAYMNHVYHHFAKPQEMLRGIWHALKPRGYLVIVDQRRGTLRDWVPREQREKKHYWIAETTVVREAREEGFAFICCAEEHWHADKDFVLVFKRPQGSENPGGDPDPFRPLSVRKCSRMFFPLGRPYERPVFVALGEARKLIAPILRHSSGKGLEIVLEEWATQKEERPLLPSRLSLPSVLTENGDPHLGLEPVDVVFLLDSYHLLFHGRTLLAKIHESLIPGGCVYILDREAKRPLSRREASHFRMIDPEVVEREMAEAGFYLWFRGPRPVRDRFLLVFGKAPPEDILTEDEPFIAGPLILEAPGRWLRRNYWRLRGFRTTDGRFVVLGAPGKRGSVVKVPSDSPGKEVWKIPQEELVLHFEKKDEKYSLTDYRSLD